MNDATHPRPADDDAPQDDAPEAAEPETPPVVHTQAEADAADAEASAEFAPDGDSAEGATAWDPSASDADAEPVAARKVPLAVLGAGIGIAAVALVGGGFAAVTLLADRGDSPQASFEAYVAGLRDGDCIAAVSQFHPTVRGGVTPAIFCSGTTPEDVSASVADVTFDYGDTDFDGDSAILEVTETVGTGDTAVTTTWDYTFSRLDGDWLMEGAQPQQ